MAGFRSGKNWFVPLVECEEGCKKLMMWRICRFKSQYLCSASKIYGLQTSGMVEWCWGEYPNLSSGTFNFIWSRTYNLKKKRNWGHLKKMCKYCVGIFIKEPSVYLPFSNLTDRICLDAGDRNLVGLSLASHGLQFPEELVGGIICRLSLGSCSF